MRNRYGENIVRIFLHNLLNVLFGQRSIFRYFGNDFPVVISDSEIFGEFSAELSAAASELHADSNDFFHSVAPLSVLRLYFTTFSAVCQYGFRILFNYGFLKRRAPALLKAQAHFINRILLLFSVMPNDYLTVFAENYYLSE